MSAYEYAYRRDIPFSLDLDEKNDLKMITDIDAINQSIYTILSTNYGDKVMEDTFGANIESFVFQNSVPKDFISSEIKGNILQAMRVFEPELEVQGVTVDNSDIKDGYVTVTIIYKVTTTDETGIFNEILSLTNNYV